MVSNRLALVALAVACVAAAGGGGYLATRQNITGVAAPAAAAAPAPVAAATQPVQETEAIVNPPAQPAPSSVARVQTPQSVPSRRTEAPARKAAPQRTPESVSARTVEATPSLDRSWPGGSTSAPAPPVAQPPQAEPQAPPPQEDDRSIDTPAVPEPPASSLEELVVSADSVIGLQTESALSSDRARVEDQVEARVVRDVRVGDKVAIPAGAHAIGTVVVVERGGKFKERARLGIRFQTLVLADGTRLPITTETIYRFGDAPGNGTAARIGGGAVIGAIIGGIVGGGKGAAIGATAGAGAGTASVMSGEPHPATFPAGAEVTARILSPVTVTVEKE